MPRQNTAPHSAASAAAEAFINSIDTGETLTLTPSQMQNLLPNSFTCPRCETPNRQLSDSHLVLNADCNYQRWCNDCSQDHSDCCSRCQGHFDTVHMDTTRIDHCQECSQLMQEMDSGWIHPTNLSGNIADYNARIRTPTRAWPGYPDPQRRYFGVELEIEVLRSHSISSIATHIGQHLSTNLFIMKSDGSLSNGIEIIACPSTLSKAEELWSPFFDNIPDGILSNKTSTCGMHVHVSRRSLTPLQIGKIIVFVNLAHNQRFIQKIAHRAPSRYCQRKEKNLKAGKLHASHDRYELVNLTPNTLEFRLFRGTLAIERFLKNVEFTDALCEFCKETSMKNLREEHFLEWMKHQPRTKYKHLKLFIKNNLSDDHDATNESTN